MLRARGLGAALTMIRKKSVGRLAHKEKFMYLCIVKRKELETLKNKAMTKELEERIERKKRMIRQFVETSRLLGMADDDIEKRLDLMLEDLNKLMGQREK